MPTAKIKKVYLSGPMTGVPNKNFGEFNRVAALLRKNGYEVINPVEFGDESKGWQFNIKRDIKLIIDEEPEGIVLLDGWQDSKGVTVELFIGNTLDILVFTLVETGSSIELIPVQKENILDEAKRLISLDRQNSYGHPLDDFSKIASLWQVVLGLDQITPEQVALAMVCVKISRELNKPGRDNVVDGAGYWATIDMIRTERDRREKSK